MRSFLSIFALLVLGSVAVGQDSTIGPALSKVRIPPPVYSILVNDGDSQFTTTGPAPLSTWMQWATPQMPRVFQSFNVSISGETLATMVSSFSSHVTPLYSASAPIFLVHPLGGANDIRGSSTAATVYALLQSYVNLVHALGSNARVAVATYPLQCDIFGNAPQLAQLQAFNNLVSAGWNVAQASGGLGADALVDYFAEPTVGANTYASSAYCSATWSADGQHLVQAGKQLMGAVQSKLAPIFPLGN